MIDWVGLFWNSLWVVGCVLGLAVLSYASYSASRRGEKYSSILNRPGFQIALQGAGVIFCIGLAGIETTGWKQYVWVGLAILFGLQIGWIVWNKRQERLA